METVLIVWIAVAAVMGQPQAGVFQSKAECMSAVAQVEAAMTSDGPDDGDMVSACIEVKLKVPGTPS